MGSELESGQTDQAGDIYTLAVECKDLFATSLRDKKAEGSHLRQYEHRFLLWASFLGVYADEKCCLDRRLRRAPEIRDLVLLMLRVLKRNLGHAISESATTSATIISLGDQNGPMYGIKEAIDRLHRIAAIIRGGARTDEVQAVRRFASKREPDGFLGVIMALTRYHFPEAQASLHFQLAKSVAYRRDWLLYQRYHSQKLAKARTPRTKTQLPIIIQPGPSSQNQAPRNKHPRSEIQSQLSSTQPSIRNINTHLLQTLGLSQQRGGSQQDVTSVYSRNPPPSGLYPTKPSVPKGERETPCKFCRVLLPATLVEDETKWRKHVDSDLRPYVCVSECCGDFPPSFPTVRDWKSHMEEKHRFDWSRYVHRVRWPCPYCSNESEKTFFPTEAALASHLSESTLAGHPSALDSVEMSRITAGNREVKPSGEDDCPLCGPPPWQEEWKPEKKSRVDVSEKSTNEGNLTVHFASHLRYLAFQSLRWWDIDTNAGEDGPTPSQSVAGSNPKDSTEIAIHGNSPTASISPDDDELKESDDDLEEVNYIENKICSSLVTSAFDKKEYLPIDQLCKILSPSVVHHLLLQHFGDAKASEYECEILGTQDGTPVSPPRRRRILAILVLIDQVKRLPKFIEDGVDDMALPFHFTHIKPARMVTVSYVPHPQDETCQEKDCPCQNSDRKDEPILKKFDVWPVRVVKEFTLWQSIIHVPFFKFPGDKIYFYDLYQDSTLPFDLYELQETGSYGSVRKVTIHPSHFNRVRNSKDEKPICFAVKKPHVPSVNDYLQEIDPFDKLGIENKDSLSNHLIPLQLTFKHGRDYYLMFPWADGNLNQFWKQHTANPKDPEEVRWFMAQCSGISRGLRKIHHLSTNLSHKAVNVSSAKQMILGGKEWGRHGDIKPENILWFQHYNGKRDHLVISDFGLTQFSSALSPPIVQQDQILGFSGTYRPPDLHLQDQPLSQNYDVWSLGCVFLEFLSWFLLGYDETVFSFAEARLRYEPEGNIREDTFFVLENGPLMTPKAKLKDSVVEWIEKLHKTPHCSEPFHALLDLIQFTMLVPNPKYRRKSSMVDLELRQLASKCKSETFAITAIPWVPDPSKYDYPPLPEQTGTARTSHSASPSGLSYLGLETGVSDAPHSHLLGADLTVAADASISETTSLTFCSIEPVIDRGNVIYMEWEQLSQDTL